MKMRDVMNNEKKISVETPSGRLTACVGGDEQNYPEIFIYLIRPDGVEVDLVAATVDVETGSATAYLYGDTSTCDWTKKHTWVKTDLDIEEDD